MKKLTNPQRVKRLISETVSSLALNLCDMTVLTEVGSGAFVVTPLIATMAGCTKVYVVVKDSPYGRKSDIIRYLYDIIAMFKLDSNIVEVIDDALSIAKKVNIVTNLGFVRPIGESLIARLPKDAAIPLMWETWEAREDDIDFKACEKFAIPVLGTRETDERLLIFRYVGILALKLLLEADIEVFSSNIIIVSSGHFLNEIKKTLQDNNANVFVYNPFERNNAEALRKFAKSADAIVIAEQVCREELVSAQGTHLSVDMIADSHATIIHISGVLDYDAIDSKKIRIHPQRRVSHGCMTVTTDYVGVKPVIKLHSAGLKVGQALVEGQRLFGNANKAKQYALQNSPAMDFEKTSHFTC